MCVPELAIHEIDTASTITTLALRVFLLDFIIWFLVSWLCCAFLNLDHCIQLQPKFGLLFTLVALLQPQIWTSSEHLVPLFILGSNNNNNKAFKSQTSWGRLELKPSRSHQGSGTWIAVFQALLSKAKSLGIFHPFKSPFIASTQVNFGLPLPLFTLLSWLRIPLRTGASEGLRCTCPNHLNRCWTSFSSINHFLMHKKVK